MKSSSGTYVFGLSINVNEGLTCSITVRVGTNSSYNISSNHNISNNSQGKPVKNMLNCTANYDEWKRKPEAL